MRLNVVHVQSSKNIKKAENKYEKRTKRELIKDKSRYIINTKTHRLERIEKEKKKGILFCFDSVGAERHVRLEKKRMNHCFPFNPRTSDLIPPNRAFDGDLLDPAEDPGEYAAFIFPV